MNERLENGIRLFRMKRWDMAIQAFQADGSEGLTAGERTELAYYMGLCYTKLERYNEALLYLEQVVTSEESPVRVCQCRMTLAYIYMVTRRAKMAEFELERLEQSGIQAVQIYTMMAYGAWLEKDYQKCVLYYKKALEIDKNNTTAINGLGFVLADTEMDIQKGLEFCKKAVELKPRNAAYMDSLGWAHFKNGDLLEARAMLRRAMDAAPHEKTIRSHMKSLVDGAGAF